MQKGRQNSLPTMGLEARQNCRWFSFLNVTNTQSYSNKRKGQLLRCVMGARYAIHVATCALHTTSRRRNSEKAKQQTGSTVTCPILHVLVPCKAKSVLIKS